MTTSMTKKSLCNVFLVPMCLLLIPLVANFTVDGFNWDPGSFVFLWAIMVGIGFAYRLATAKVGNLAHRIATGIALLAGFLIVWGNLAVGFIGSDDNPANLLYFVALLIAAICAAISRFTPAGMARTMFIAAFSIALVPAIALLVRPHDFSPGVAQVFGLNAFFVLLFAVSGFLFRHAAGKPDDAGPPITA